MPESNGLSMDFTRAFVKEFIDAVNFEFVEWAVSGDEDSENIVHELVGIVAKSFD